MRKYIIIIIIFIFTTSYKDLDKSPYNNERLLIEKSLDRTEKEIIRINEILNNPNNKYKIKI